jgi:TetR/AcrR family transcriptional regulator, cholesterol catabolism regulator
MLIAHAWALKQWYFQRTLTLDTYIRKQTALTLAALIAPRSRRKYAPLIAAPDTRG